MKSLKTAILALSVAALPLTAFAQATAPVDAAKPAPSASVNTGVAGNSGIVPPKVGVTSDTKAGIDGTRADARTGSSLGAKTDGKAAVGATTGATSTTTDAKASGAVKADPAKSDHAVKKTDKHSAVTTHHRKHVAAAKPAVKTDTKAGTVVR